MYEQPTGTVGACIRINENQKKKKIAECECAKMQEIIQIKMTSRKFVLRKCVSDRKIGQLLQAKANFIDLPGIDADDYAVLL